MAFLSRHDATRVDSDCTAKVHAKEKITFSGTASDAFGIQSVQYRIGKGPLKTATGTTSWTLKAKLKKGKNTITIFATDVDGIVSANRVIKITRK
ncbi:MAG: hypothetical protein HC767_03330 [Akkermansiaceae bacterium]|nr:hypothetical protein [Akkermansiaceae bacterium]